MDLAARLLVRAVRSKLHPSGAKAGGDYRSPYHAGRSMVDCLHLANAILGGAPNGGCTLV